MTKLKNCMKAKQMSNKYREAWRRIYENVKQGAGDICMVLKSKSGRDWNSSWNRSK